MAFCFVDLTGFTRYTEEEGDEEALDLVERFVETVEATLPAEALIVKTIGDEVMIVSPDPVTLTEWAVGFLGLFGERPQPRVGIHYGRAVYRDGDYFGGEVNLTHRVVARALGGEVMVTAAVVDAIGELRLPRASSRSAGSSSRASRSRSSCSSCARPASRAITGASARLVRAGSGPDAADAA